jgi:error-prone DNA polymerase
MTAGGEVVEDYGHVGLSLREHPVSFLRQDLIKRRYVTCSEAMQARDGRWMQIAGLVLVRQKPGSAKGVMFITIEDETGVANVVIWPSLYEKQRRIILTATMLGINGKIQREGEVVHFIAQRLTDLSSELASVGQRNTAFPLSHGRGDEFHGGGPGIDPRTLPQKTVLPKDLQPTHPQPKHPPRDIFIPDRHIDTIVPKTRDFR